VDHADVVTNYRAGHDIATRHGEDGADTEALRQAMIHYRALFQELVGEVVDASSTTTPDSVIHAETSV